MFKRPTIVNLYINISYNGRVKDKIGFEALPMHVLLITIKFTSKPSLCHTLCTVLQRRETINDDLLIWNLDT